MVRYFLIIALTSLLSYGFSQTPVYRNSFESLNKQYKTTRGIKGNALNFTIDAFFRHPLIEKIYHTAPITDFTITCWVKSPASAKQEYHMLSSIDSTDEIKTEWTIGIQNNGAWYFKLNQYTRKDTLEYDYHPLPAVQAVNDNKWHELAISYDHAKNEFAFYYDGRNKAIIHTEKLGVSMINYLHIGGIPEGLTGEWNTFNGYIDELNLYDTVLPASFFETEYKNLSHHIIHAKRIPPVKSFSVMNYNILHGGHETGKETGVQRIVDVIKSSGADIISMQETYGSGPAIADALGYYFYLRSTNLAVFSRFPIESSLPAGIPFNSGGVLIDIPGNHKIAFFTNWLNYPFDYWDMLEKGMKIDSATWYEREDSVNAGMLRYTLKCILPFVNSSKNISVIFCGDLNTGSHLDWTEATRHLNNGYVMPFPATKLMEEESFIDSYRVLHPDPVKDRGTTWSPFFPNAFKDRIDYIFYKSDKLKPVLSKTISTHPVRYPSDHAAVITTFVVKK